MRLVQGSRDHLPSYVAALQAGWSADNVRGAAAAQEELERIQADPDGFLASLYDPEARGDPIKMPDGSTVARIPGFVKWMWDGEFCGSIGFRWLPGTERLPPHCLGHIGYAVVPRKRGLGYATQALKEMLPEAKARGLRFVELTTDLDNVPSQRVVLAAGGVLAEQFTKPAQYGGREGLRFRIDL
jgi:predicted acetyltransferase